MTPERYREIIDGIMAEFLCRPVRLDRDWRMLAEEGERAEGAPRRSDRMITGAPAMVRERLDELLTLSGADELMAMTNVHAFEDRMRSLELLAEAFHLEPSDGPQAAAGAAASS